MWKSTFVVATSLSLLLPVVVSAAEFELRWDLVRVNPGETNVLRIDPAPEASSLAIRLLHPLGVEMGRYDHAPTASIPITAPALEGGFIVQVATPDGEIIGRSVLSVCSSPEQDIRYGFAANYGRYFGDYSHRAEMLTEVYVNAVEYFDYFESHGDYTPTRERYRFEPFGVHIDARDVRAKQEAYRQANIQNYAYVAPYSATQSVYDRIPDPVLGSDGSPLVYGPDHVRSAREYDAAGKSDNKWFYIMAIHQGARWRAHVLEEYRKILAGEDTILLPFDGMEIDTYGIEDRQYRSQNWTAGTVTVGHVLHDFMRDARDVSDSSRPRAYIASNTVNGHELELRAPFVDWQFMEVWPWGAATFGEYINLMEHARAAAGHRVVVKSYPDQLRSARDVWPTENLRLMMGMAMLAGGSFMVAGEPNPDTGRLHSLKTDYYGDNSPLPRETWEVLRSYNRLDALLYRITHGANVTRISVNASAPGFITRTYQPGPNGVAIVLLRLDPATEWTRLARPVSQPRSTTLTIPWRGGLPQTVRLGSPDDPQLEFFEQAPFRVEDGRLLVELQPFARFGCILIGY